MFFPLNSSMKYAGQVLRRSGRWGGEGLGGRALRQSNTGNNSQANGRGRPDAAVVLALASNYNLLSISRLHWSRLRGEGQQQSIHHIREPVVLKGG